MTDPNPISIISSVDSPSEGDFLLFQGQTFRELPAIVNGNTFMANESLVIPDILVDGLIHRSTKSVFGGPSKAGKTWILIDLAVSVANGTPFLSWKTSKGKVLFINFEIDEGFLKKRFENILRHKGSDINLENIDIWTLRGYNLNFSTILLDIIRNVKDCDYSLIVLDPIYKLMTGLSENSSNSVGELCRNIDELITHTKAAIVYSHHLTKGIQSGRNHKDRLSGSGVFSRDADTILILTEHKVDNCYVIETTLRNMPSKEPFVVEWKYPLMITRPDLDPTEIKNSESSNKRESIELVKSLVKDKPLTTREWENEAKSKGISRATFFRARKHLLETGEVNLKPLDKTLTVPGLDNNPRIIEV